MLSVNEHGHVKHVGPVINHTVMAPNKRDVLNAWERVAAGKANERDKDVIARALGVPLLKGV